MDLYNCIVFHIKEMPKRTYEEAFNTVEKQEHKRLPTINEYRQLKKDDKITWDCIVCGGPALGGSYIVGRLCSTNCAFIHYD